MRRRGVHIGAHHVGFYFVAMDAGARAGVIDGIQQREQFDGAVAIAQQRKCQCGPHGGVRVLAAVFAQARRVGLDITRILRAVVKRRREQLHEPIAAADELGVDRGHCAKRALPRSRTGDHGPGLRHGIDAAFVAGYGTQDRAVVIIAAPIPVAVPGFAFDGLLHGERMLAPGAGGFLGAARLGDRRKAHQCRVQEPGKPHALAASQDTDAIHAVVPIARAEQRQAVRTNLQARVECARAMLE